eukprot:8254230-Pyramimonas_sp.AAC.1
MPHNHLQWVYCLMVLGLLPRLMYIASLAPTIEMARNWRQIPPGSCSCCAGRAARVMPGRPPCK